MDKIRNQYISREIKKKLKKYIARPFSKRAFQINKLLNKSNRKCKYIGN